MQLGILISWRKMGKCSLLFNFCSFALSPSCPAPRAGSLAGAVTAVGRGVLEPAASHCHAQTRLVCKRLQHLN